MLRQMTDSVDKVELRRRAVSKPVVPLGILPRAAKIRRQISAAVQISVHQIGMNFIILCVADIGIGRLPVVLHRISERAHQRMCLRAVLRMNEEVDIAEGAQPGDRIKPAQIIALYRHMGDALLRKALRQGLEVHAAVEIARHRAVEKSVQTAADVRVVKQPPALVLIRQHREQALLRSRFPERRDVPRRGALRRSVLYQAAQQQRKLCIRHSFAFQVSSVEQGRSRRSPADY